MSTYSEARALSTRGAHVQSLRSIAPYATGLLLPLGALVSVLEQRWLCVPPLAFLLGVPIADFWLGEATVADAPSHQGRELGLSLARLAAVLHVAVIVSAVARVAIDASSLCAALLCSVGVSSGAALNVAHELAHSKRRSDFWLAQIINWLCHLPHSPYEHRLHHALAGTAMDPATSRKGESLYAFSVRYLRDGFRMAHRAGRGGPLRGSRLTWSLFAPSLVFLAVGVATWSWAPTVLLLGQAFIAVALACAGNYIAHHGLERDTTRKHPVVPAWNDRHRASLYALWAVGRHSSHHGHPSRGFVAATDVADAPRLPFPYSAAVVLSFVPPLWKRLMKPALDAQRASAPKQPGSQL